MRRRRASGALEERGEALAWLLGNRHHPGEAVMSLARTPRTVVSCPDASAGRYVRQESDSHETVRDTPARPLRGLQGRPGRLVDLPGRTLVEGVAAAGRAGGGGPGP